MENVKILVDGIQKDVYGLFYIYDSKYYFIYTEKEVDENNYVILYMSQVGKETRNTENGPVDTGYMVGIEVTNPEEQQKVQTSISYIVEDKKNNTINPQIQYLPMSMLTNLKIVSKKRFRLLKSIMIDNFKLQLDNVISTPTEVTNQSNISPIIQPVSVDNNVVSPVIPQPVVTEVPVSTPIAQSPVSVTPIVQPVVQTISSVPVAQQQLQATTDIVNQQAPAAIAIPQIDTTVNNPANDVNIIVDYRTKYFEEEEKNKELQAQIEELTQKLNDIKKVLE